MLWVLWSLFDLHVNSSHHFDVPILSLRLPEGQLTVGLSNVEVLEIVWVDYRS